MAHQLLAGLRESSVDNANELLVPLAINVSESEGYSVSASIAVSNGQKIDLKSHRS